ncbi:winged helix-turn-helix domain-containing protein [Klebsiella oxytoca]|uniref:winged helix-turn-helix domain-containing protein n=1 Tax=Klebsiella oxytoca TaxID=571 RepID=UPI00157BA8D6|nr:hypothetical protein [Klebsiella oxytoca]
MVKQYLIDDQIIFSPAEQKLLSVASGKGKVMHGNVSRCLELLIMHQGTVIPQNELVLYGWGKDVSASVTTAAYYQCFVNLRKNLKELDYTHELVVTLRKVGVKIDSGVNISLLEQEDESPRDISDEDRTHDDLLCVSNPVARKEKAPVSKVKAFVMASFATVLAVLIYLVTLTPAEGIEGFVQIKNYPACYHYNIKNVDNTTPTQFMIEQKNTCDGERNYYISYFSTSPRLSYFSCGKESSSFCESVTHILYLK